MKTTLHILLLLTLSFTVACHANRKTVETTDKPDVTSKSALSDEGPPVIVNDEVAGYEKTPCYGQCPVFKVRFYADGKVTWYGHMNVERLGNYEAKVEQSVISGIQKKALEIGFYKFEEEYPVNYKIADLPYTITFVRYGDKAKAVRNMTDAPEALVMFEEYLEGIIGKLDWKKAKA